MFDDKPIAPQGGAPQNLPLGEPEDLFAQTDTNMSIPPSAPVAEPVSVGSRGPEVPSALEAGILKPIEPPPLPPPLPFQNQEGVAPAAPAPMMDGSASMNTLKEPSMSRGILVVIIIVVAVLLIGGAGWRVYRYLNVPQEAATPVLDEEENETITVPPVEEPSEDTTPSDLEEVPAVVDETDVTSTQPVDETLLFGDSTDTDGDGLDDRREATLGTDPEKVDTDSDELTDGDEVIIWNTNPLNPDTDGDTFLDGKEIKAGFSPKGSGKLFEVKSTSSTTVTSS